MLSVLVRTRSIACNPHIVQVWNDSKTANVISTALFSEVSKIKTTALRFFLGGDQEDDGSDDEQDPNAGKTYDEMLKNNTAKKTNRRKRLLKAQLQKEHKKERQKDKAEVSRWERLFSKREQKFSGSDHAI